MTGGNSFNLWTKAKLNGERELRASTKVFLSLLPFILGAALFQALVTFEKIAGGAEVIEVLAYIIIILVVVMSLVTLLISLIDYLRSLE
ncbi:MAG: hypothetical protein GY792_35855 [Gammaproteobacteria bacterium]|nr:hypothetical protein [Gammaproteobacteria bacterium]